MKNQDSHSRLYCLHTTDQVGSKKAPHGSVCINLVAPPLSPSISCFHVYRDVCARELVERHRLPAPGSFPTSMHTFPVVLRLQLEIFLHRGSTHHSQYICPTLPVTVCQVFVLLQLNKVVTLFYFSFVVCYAHKPFVYVQLGHTLVTLPPSSATSYTASYLCTLIFQRSISSSPCLCTTYTTYI